MSDQKTGISPYQGVRLRKNLSLKESLKCTRNVKCAVRNLGRISQTDSPFKYPMVFRLYDRIEFVGNATIDTRTGTITTTPYESKIK